MKYQKRLDKARESINTLIGEHGSTVVFDALALFAGDMHNNRAFSEEVKGTWWHLQSIFLALANLSAWKLAGNDLTGRKGG